MGTRPVGDRALRIDATKYSTRAVRLVGACVPPALKLKAAAQLRRLLLRVECFVVIPALRWVIIGRVGPHITRVTHQDRLGRPTN